MVNKRVDRSVPYQDDLVERLKDHEFALEYLNAALEESKLGDEDSQKILLDALRDVAEAQGGIGPLARKAHVRRENIYRILSPTGNPELRTFTALIRAMGLELRFC